MHRAAARLLVAVAVAFGARCAAGAAGLLYNAVNRRNIISGTWAVTAP